MKTHSFIFISILLLAITSCNNKQKKDNAPQQETEINKTDLSISNISVLYYNYIVESEAAISPNDIQLDLPQFEKDRKGVLDATIDDSIKIGKLKSRIDSLRPAQQPSPIDARLVAIINYTNGIQDQLCIGGKYVNKIFLNGAEQETDNQLLFLLKNYIGFYPWMIGDDMFAMQELQDASFPKGPFVSTPYYEAYQEALNKR
ncbi:hypothetical protein CLV62_101429 [Dysgonomonas alginatilytica]|uniref:Uncharacterized protein n=1 Tax=Dysgonomonas alginatilytica TaxID=1605892 RepID=A0A2V3PTX6_9BACT|nr:hypothetical protein [Dysgonomonas alginatilytica]PXV69160.1 hypothetical protein CLV62_101429 [Dysgonomonas alginatilytica]